MMALRSLFPSYDLQGDCVDESHWHPATAKGKGNHGDRRPETGRVQWV
jgi:hypothetical protein